MHKVELKLKHRLTNNVLSPEKPSLLVINYYPKSREATLGIARTVNLKRGVNHSF